MIYRDNQLHNDKSKAHTFTSDYADVSCLQISSELRKSVKSVPACKSLFSPSVDMQKANEYNTAITAIKSKGVTHRSLLIDHISPCGTSRILVQQPKVIC